jgi:hypothetical protein
MPGSIQQMEKKTYRIAYKFSSIGNAAWSHCFHICTGTLWCTYAISLSILTRLPSWWPQKYAFICLGKG